MDNDKKIKRPKKPKASIEDKVDITTHKFFNELMSRSLKNAEVLELVVSIEKFLKAKNEMKKLDLTRKHLESVVENNKESPEVITWSVVKQAEEKQSK